LIQKKATLPEPPRDHRRKTLRPGQASGQNERFWQPERGDENQGERSGASSSRVSTPAHKTKTSRPPRIREVGDSWGERVQKRSTLAKNQ